MGKNFRGGRLVAVFGGIEIDLWQAEMEGDEAVLQIDAIFGGVEFVCQIRGWFPRTGKGFRRLLRFDPPAPPTDPTQPRKTLVIAGRRFRRR